MVSRARVLAQLARAPSAHVARNRRTLHQLTRELRASARRTALRGVELGRVHGLVLSRSSARALGPERIRRGRELERLALALAAHDPQRTLARGYALVADRDGAPLTSAAAARVVTDRQHALVDPAPHSVIGDSEQLSRLANSQVRHASMLEYAWAAEELGSLRY